MNVNKIILLTSDLQLNVYVMKSQYLINIITAKSNDKCIKINEM